MDDMQNPPQSIASTNGARYRVKKCISKHAHTTVFLAEQLSLGREVIMKFIHTDDERATRRFQREVRALSMLRHPNNVRIFDFGVGVLEQQTRPFIVMEYINGTSLRRVLEDQRRLSPLRALRIGIQVLRGLAEAHRLGVYHRDVKPENMMLADHDDLRDHVTLIDFGIARTADAGEGTATGRGMMPGTPQYMAPEVIDGGEPTVFNDLYCVGVVLYECLTGRRPFDGAEPLSVMYKVVNTDFTPVNQIVPISTRFAEIVHTALAKRPEDRYASAEEFLAAFTSLDLCAISRSHLPVGEGHLVTQELRTLELQTRMSESKNASPPVEHAEMLEPSSHKPVVWALTEDPGIDGSISHMLHEVVDNAEVRLLNSEERVVAAEQLEEGTLAPPWLVVFGDMHVIIQDPLLGVLQDRTETGRVLVSTHLNDQMLHSALTFCGVDRQLLQPVSREDLGVVLTEMLDRARKLHRFRDGLRIALTDARQDLEAMCRKLSELRDEH